MKTLLLTNEYPPMIYGGAGVHVEYLSRELARLMDVEVRRSKGNQLISRVRRSLVCMTVFTREKARNPSGPW